MPQELADFGQRGALPQQLGGQAMPKQVSPFARAPASDPVRQARSLDRPCITLKRSPSRALKRSARGYTLPADLVVEQLYALLLAPEGGVTLVFRGVPLIEGNRERGLFT